nr:glycosyltransferase [uncultured Undibacterium sp.]
MSTQNDLLLLDALNQVISDPLGRHSWRRLNLLVIKNTNIEVEQAILERIYKEIDAHGLIGFYRAIFLGHVLRIKSEIMHAGKVLAEIRPIHVDRIMAFINYEWSNIIAEAQCRAEFSHLLESMNIPKLMEITNNYIQSIAPPHTTQKAMEVKRIAIYTPQLHNYKHPPTKMVFEHTRLLQLLGFEIKIFSCMEHSISDMREYLSDGGHLKLPPVEESVEIDFKLQAPVEIVRTQEQFSLPLRAQSALHEIHLFKPDLCFFIGHQSIILKSLYQHYPILALNISSIAPCGNFDLWLSPESEAKDAVTCAKRDLCFNLSKNAYYHPFRTIPKMKLASLHRGLLQLTEDHVILITVGSRLEKEISGEWAASMLDIYTVFPNLVWLIVGANGQIPSALQAASPNYIKPLPSQDNLRGIYDCCDIYVNPPRLGGGFSVAEAMAQGLPALAFVDTDGGKKLDKFASNTNEEYFAELRHLIQSADARKIRGKQLQEIFETTINLENSAPSLLRAIELCRENFEQRVSNGS